MVLLISYLILLDRTKFEPMILTLSSEIKKNSLKDLFINELNIKVFSLELNRVKGFFLAKNKVLKILKDYKINIVHSQGIRADNIMSKIGYIPRIATLRNYPYDDYVMTYGKPLGYIMAINHLKALSKIDKPFTVSKSISQMLDFNNKFKIDFIRNGIDLTRFVNLKKEIARKKLKISMNEKIFISVGHINERKDPTTIINAFSKMNDNYKLIFLGDGPLRNDLEINKDMNITFLGNINNIGDYLIASDYFISSSLAEYCFRGIIMWFTLYFEINNINKKSSLIFKVKDSNDLLKKLNQILLLDYDEMQRK